MYLESGLLPGGKALNVAAFRAVTEARQGTLSRNVLRAFPLRQVDLSVRRDFTLTERLKLQFRAEAYNLFNHPNFGAPVLDIANPRSERRSRTTAQDWAPAELTPGSSPLYQVGTPRSISWTRRDSRVDATRDSVVPPLDGNHPRALFVRHWDQRRSTGVPRGGRCRISRPGCDRGVRAVAGRRYDCFEIRQAFPEMHLHTLYWPENSSAPWFAEVKTGGSEFPVRMRLRSIFTLRPVKSFMFTTTEGVFGAGSRSCTLTYLQGALAGRSTAP